MPEKIDFRNLMTLREDVPPGFQQFNAIPIGSGWSISVQGSFTHYSVPRENVPAHAYDSFEVGLLYAGSLSQPPEDFPWKHLWANDTVAGYVSHILIQEIYEWFRANYGPPMQRLVDQTSDFIPE